MAILFTGFSTKKANALNCTGLSITLNQFTNQPIYYIQNNVLVGSYVIANSTSDTIKTTNLSLSILQLTNSLSVNFITGLYVNCSGQISPTNLISPSWNNILNMNIIFLPGESKIVDVFMNINANSTGTIQTALSYTGSGLHSGITYPNCPPNTAQAATIGQLNVVSLIPPTVDFSVNTNSVCQNQSIYISNVSTYDTSYIYEWHIAEANQLQTWIGHDLPSGISFYGSGQKTIELYMYDSYGNTWLKTKTITVWPSPYVNGNIVPQNPTLGCGNTPVSLSINAIGQFHYRWKNGIGAIVDTNAVFIATLPGSYSVEISNSYGCISNWNANTYVQNNPKMNPRIILGNSQNPGVGSNLTLDTIKACINTQGTYNLEVTANYWEYLQWNDGTSSYPGNFINSGKKWVSVWNSLGCKESDTVMIVLNQKPVSSITGITTFCQNSGTTLSLDSGAYIYKWSTGQSTRKININWSNDITGYVVDINGCESNHSIVQTNALVIPDNSVTYSNNIAWILYPVSTDHYQWYSDTVLINGATGSSFQAINAGTYKVRITNNLGCDNTSQVVWLNSSLGVESNQQINEKIYPNPFQSYFNIEFSDNENHTIKLYDVAGREIYQSTGNEYLKIEKENLESGIYFLQIDTRKELAKIIKE